MPRKPAPAAVPEYDAVDRALTAGEHPHDVIGALVDHTSVAAIVDVLARDYHGELMRVVKLIHCCPVCRIHYVPDDDEDACDPRYCGESCAQDAARECDGCGRPGGHCRCP